jgi:fumarate hydratase, class II
MPTRIETDSMGAVEVPADDCWGAQTQRSLESVGCDRARGVPPVSRGRLSFPIVLE